MKANDITKVREFVEALGLTEEPMGMLYTNELPKEGISPKPGALPTVEDEAAQRVPLTGPRRSPARLHPLQ